ncbi:serine hydrolase domain-containing protein [Streptomyces sp. NPDC006512]|uniref:serine hydrolase domain-containing protein n=1 Tax=Streptomyces sp. NPDC006512 TaxID=3154307 RepID=UPI0033A8A6F3
MQRRTGRRRGARAALAAVVALAGWATACAPGTPRGPEAPGPSASAGSPAAQSSGTRFPAGVERQLKEAVDDARRAHDVPGIRVDVNVPGHGAWEYAVGAADLRTGRPITAEDKVRIASVTKTFTATAVLQLVRAGKLRLDDPLSRYVSWPNGDAITIRQLLNMTAGIYSYTEDPAWLKRYTEHPDAPFRTRDALDIARRHAPYFAPGKGFHYSDTHYVLLGDIVEKAGGKPLATWVREEIAKPLGLAATGLPTDSAVPEPAARGYRAGPGGAMTDATRSDPAYAAGAGAMLSNIADLRFWARELATGTGLLTPGLQRERLRLVPVAAEPEQVGYGLGIASFDGWLGHNGTIIGYNTAMFHDPRSHSTVVVEMNRSFATLDEDHATELFLRIARIVTPKT